MKNNYDDLGITPSLQEKVIELQKCLHEEQKIYQKVVEWLSKACRVEIDKKNNVRFFSRREICKVKFSLYGLENTFVENVVYKLTGEKTVRNNEEVKAFLRPLKFKPLGFVEISINLYVATSRGFAYRIEPSHGISQNSQKNLLRVSKLCAKSNNTEVLRRVVPTLKEAIDVCQKDHENNICDMLDLPADRMY